jgi:HD-GYP domain-containing protein (c-di-GMP phosphodiesterase class II)
MVTDRLKNLTDEERQQCLHHAADASELLEGHPEASDYIRLVIKQSHGKIDGIGFADDPGEDLHPLSKVFIIADNFIKILLNPQLPSNKTEILPLLEKRFTNESYQKIIRALEQKYQN